MTAATRKQAQAGGGRAEAEHPLHVEREDHLESHRGADDEQLGEVGAPNAPGGQHAQREQRRPGGGLPDDEAGEQRYRDEAGPPGRGLDDGVDAEHDADGDCGRAERVRPGAQPPALVRGQQPPAGDPGEQADGHVHEEDPVPARQLHEQAADDQAGRGADRADEGERADRPSLLAGLAE
jgi:hypothetical protein